MVGEQTHKGGEMLSIFSEGDRLVSELGSMRMGDTPVDVSKISKRYLMKYVSGVSPEGAELLGWRVRQDEHHKLLITVRPTDEGPWATVFETKPKYFTVLGFTFRVGEEQEAHDIQHLAAVSVNEEDGWKFTNSEGKIFSFGAVA